MYELSSELSDLKRRKSNLLSALDSVIETEERLKKFELDPFKAGDVVKFKLKFSLTENVYQYAAIKLGIDDGIVGEAGARWFVTGSTNKKNSYLTYAEFVSLYLIDAFDIEYARRFKKLDISDE